MVNVGGFERLLEDQINDKLYKPLAELEKTVAIRVYSSIFTNWPTDTFWSSANNHASISGKANFKLIPSVRPTGTGALAVQDQANFNSNIKLLNTITGKMVKKRGFKIFLGNTVPYAPDVSFTPGKGTLIYAEAVRQGKNVRRRGR